MALVDEFASLYTNHVYKNGISVNTSPADPDGLKNPRGLARAVNYGGIMPSGHEQYPWKSELSTGTIVYKLGVQPSDSALDADPPALIPNHLIPAHLEQSLIDANYIAKRPIVNTNVREITATGISQLRVQLRIP